MILICVIMPFELRENFTRVAIDAPPERARGDRVARRKKNGSTSIERADSANSQPPPHRATSGRRIRCGGRRRSRTVSPSETLGGVPAARRRRAPPRRVRPWWSSTRLRWRALLSSWRRDASGLEGSVTRRDTRFRFSNPNFLRLCRSQVISRANLSRVNFFRLHHSLCTYTARFPSCFPTMNDTVLSFKWINLTASQPLAAPLIYFFKCSPHAYWKYR